MSKLNLVISETNSFLDRSEGQDVAVFSSAVDKLPELFESLGFARHYRKGTSFELMDEYPTNQFFNAKTQESIFLSYSDNGEWTFSGSYCEPVTTTNF